MGTKGASGLGTDRDLPLPEPIARVLAGYRTDGVNRATASPARVLRYARGEGEDLFLKIQRHDEASNEPGLEPEHAIMAWLDGRAGAPRPVAFQVDGDTQYLLACAVPGRSASSGFPEEVMPHLVRLLAQGLRRIHALPADGCPRDARAARLVTRAEVRRRRGQLAPPDRDDLRQRLEQLREGSVPEEQDPVLTHGDYCLPNVMVRDDRLAGVLDWGYAGIGDRYRDYMAVDYSIRRNLGDEWVKPFFEEYGADPDPEAMARHRLLYELW